MSKDDGGAAFPQSMERYGGLTIRDWFAGQIAGGMAAHSGTMGTPFGPGDIAKRSYEIADALLTARDAQ